MAVQHGYGTSCDNHMWKDPYSRWIDPDDKDFDNITHRKPKHIPIVHATPEAECKEQGGC